MLIVRRDGPDEIRLGVGEPAARLLSERDWLLVIGPDWPLGSSAPSLYLARIRGASISGRKGTEALDGVS